MLASEIIRESCCGQMLPIDVPKHVLAKKVEDLENQVVFLDHQLNKAIAELQRRPKR